MNVLVTGSNGFIGKNLCLWLKNVGQNVLPYDLDCKYSLSSLIAKSDFIFHLAGVNRPLTIEEFYDGNANLTLALTQLVARTGRNIPICFASSVQAALNNDYGKSKKMAEDCLINFSKKTGNSIYIFRLQNVFGKWCKPNYNSVIATFCYNVSHGLPISITDRRAFRDFVYIDDICRRFITLLDQKASKPKKCVLSIEPSYKKTIGEIADLIREFKESRANLLLPCVGDEFVSKLYATYLSYLEPTAGLEYQLDSHVDQRGSFTEF